ncbi:adenylosuccinate lyase [Tenacibaculum sp.]|nr:adenylosuccinate lyase [Tenacibaculum sp.]
MDTDYIFSILKDIENAAKINRKKAANIVLQEPYLFNDLLKTTFLVDNKLSIKAAWILEWICTHHGLNLLISHLDYFINNIQLVHFDSAIRPCSKICEHLANQYTAQTPNLIQQKLTNQHIDTIIETGFDWLITPQKIAVRAYSMQTLYLLGLKKTWVHSELQHLISTKIIHESKGCEARGKKILQLIKKQSLKID